MNRLLEYAGHHVYLVSATVLVALIAIAYELWQRGRNANAISPAVAIRLHNQGGLVLDVRPPEEFNAGHIVDARNVPLASLKQSLDSIKKYRDKPVIVCCEQGVTATQAARLLQAEGFNNVAKLQGGLATWRQENLPLVQSQKAKG
jgi:rhodanese-related sulfurtransferase